MKTLLKVALKIASTAGAVGLHLNTIAADGGGSSVLWKIMLNPPGGEMIVSSIEIDPLELQMERSNHPGISEGKVVPCLAKGIFFTEYYRINEISEFVAHDEKNLHLGGKRLSPPLNVTLKSGKKLDVASQIINGAAHPWRICAESGDKFAFAFRTLNVRPVNRSETLKVHTAEVIKFKELTPNEVEDLKSTQISDFSKAMAKATSKDLSHFIISNTFSDVAGLIGKAEKARQNAIYEEGAPMRARQARMQQELERNKNERIAELEKAAAELRKALKVGDETNCGPVIEIKSGLVKVYRPLLNYGNEHWLRLEQILPAGQGCIFENGQYVGS